MTSAAGPQVTKSLVSPFSRPHESQLKSENIQCDISPGRRKRRRPAFAFDTSQHGHEHLDERGRSKQRRKNRIPNSKPFKMGQKLSSSQRKFRPKAGGLSNIIPSLNGPVGAPELPVLTTKDPRIIERWLVDHVPAINTDGISDTSSCSTCSILGFDIESIAKPPWKPERASLPDGPATIQLSTPHSCLIVPLARCGDGSALYAPEVVREVVNNPRIIKVGVGIDDDALELYRWSRMSFPDGSFFDPDSGKKLWEMTSRLDIGCILPKATPSRRSGIRELALTVLGVQIDKSKKLTMSNWGQRHLTLEQIAYAARDAWVSAAVLEKLQNQSQSSRPHFDRSSPEQSQKQNGNISENLCNVFAPEKLLEMEFLKSQRDVRDMDQRAVLRKRAKEELKELMDREKVKKSDDKSVQSKQSGELLKQDEGRKKELMDLLDCYRPDQPPIFDEGAVTLPFY